MAKHSVRSFPSRSTFAVVPVHSRRSAQEHQHFTCRVEILRNTLMDLPDYLSHQPFQRSPDTPYVREGLILVLSRKHCLGSTSRTEHVPHFTVIAD